MDSIIKVKLLVDEKIVIETLNRIGIAHEKSRILYPSCILYKSENLDYYIMHFKQYYYLVKNGYDNITGTDITRRNAIIWNLCNWKLITCDMTLITEHNIFVYVLPFKEKRNWIIKSKVNHKYD